MFCARRITANNFQKQTTHNSVNSSSSVSSQLKFNQSSFLLGATKTPEFWVLRISVQSLDYSQLHKEANSNLVVVRTLQFYL